MKKLMNKKGFTLMEMLIVVAIIVILVAISIPTFSSQLDNAKAATDNANLRAAKAVANTKEMVEGWEEYDDDEDVETLFSGTLYYDADEGKFVSDSSKADKGQSSDYSSKYITVTITDGKLTAGPDWN